MAKKKTANKKLNVNFKLSGKKPNIKQKHLVLTSVFIALVLFGASGWLWWTKILTDPNRVLADSISKNLSINGVTRTVIQGDSSGGINQTAHLSFFAPNASAETSTELSQKGSSRQETKITTETIGTSKADFVRYTSVEGADGLPGAENLQKLLGTWAKREADPSKGETLDFLNESLFGIVPFGNLNSEDRDQLIKKINEKNLYKYSSATREIKSLRPVYVYRMSINTQDLIEILAEYAKLTGLADSNQFNPDDYVGAPPISVDLTVDIFSRNLTGVTYNATDRTETYSGWNLYRPAATPEDAITIQELQNRIQGQDGA